jgi:nucleoside-diphosphate-sugar epimerase
LITNYENQVSPRLSNPDSVRDFIYIDDVVDCYLDADKVLPFPGSIINIGSGIQVSI